MTAQHSFLINLQTDDDQLTDEFRLFVAKSSLSEEAANDAVSDFAASVVPHLDGMRKIALHGGNVDFSRSVGNEESPIAVGINTTRPGLIENLMRILGG